MIGRQGAASRRSASGFGCVDRDVPSDVSSFVGRGADFIIATRASKLGARGHPDHRLPLPKESFDGPILRGGTPAGQSNSRKGGTEGAGGVAHEISSPPFRRWVWLKELSVIRTPKGNIGSGCAWGSHSDAPDVRARSGDAWTHCFEPDKTDSITLSRLKLPGFCRGGNSRKLCSHWPTIPAAGATMNMCSANQRS